MTILAALRSAPRPVRWKALLRESGRPGRGVERKAGPRPALYDWSQEPDL